jgi:hypothetical protein
LSAIVNTKLTESENYKKNENRTYHMNAYIIIITKEITKRKNPPKKDLIFNTFY